MEYTNNPENQKPNVPHDLGQITKGKGGTSTTDYPEWVIVENAGTDNEGIWSDHYTQSAAIRELKDAGGRENGFDLMKRLADGTLTTEF